MTKPPSSPKRSKASQFKLLKDLVPEDMTWKNTTSGLVVPDGITEPDALFIVEHRSHFSEALGIFTNPKFFPQFAPVLGPHLLPHTLLDYAITATRQWVNQIERQKLEGEATTSTNYYRLFKTYADMIDVEPDNLHNAWPEVTQVWNHIFQFDSETSYPIPPEVRNASNIVKSTGEKSSGKSQFKLN